MKFLFASLFLGLTLSAQAETSRYWVHFKDKGSQDISEAQSALSDRALFRRMKNSVSLNEGDIPVSQSYINELETSGVRVRAVSKWLNAASIEATPELAEQILGLNFVQSVEPFRLRRAERNLRSESAALDTLPYGSSWIQNQLCGIPELHERGLSGEGVLLCMLDTGFRTSHNALSDLDIVATRDFIFGDSVVHNEAGQDSFGQHLHGTAVLSACAGYTDSMLIGPAFGVSVMLAKTEWTEDETQVEEDYYVAALEWADSAGADLTSSSLGYLDWYTQDQMDGHSAVTTLAVLEATRRGILVVSAAGNERESEWGTIISPADADSILAIGGTDSLGVLSTFSSPGPSADGRIKPDCAAMATEVLGANGMTDEDYWRLSGTSLATPIVAGVCALIMEAHPEWTAQQVRQAILRTASQTDMPDNDLGYGVVNGPAAADYIFDSTQDSPLFPSLIQLSAFPNPVNGYVTIKLTLPAGQDGSLVLYDLLGREALKTSQAEYSVGAHEMSISIESLASGKYFAQFIGEQRSATIPIIVIK